MQQSREEVYSKTQIIHDKIKNIPDRRPKEDYFQLDDLVLKYDSRNEDKEKHGKFDHLWKGPYKVAAFQGNNSFS